MRCFCFLRNTSDIQFYGTTPYFKRFGRQFLGKKIPFGAEIAYMKFDRNAKVIRDHPLAQKIHKAIFIGYDVRPG